VSTNRPYLSKSRLISAWQCPKKLHLEKHHKELGVITAKMESAFAGGHQVGDVAQQIYGTDDSVEIEFNFKTMVAQTQALFDRGVKSPIFEATFRYEGVLIRADVMIPDDYEVSNGWRVIEVKASTSVKDYHVLDCAIQDWVLRNAGINVTSISLAHINNQFVYAGDGNYEGLLVENDLTDDVRAMEPRVLDLLEKARAAVTGPMPQVNVGPQCNNPYDCQFQDYCWPTDTKYPVMGLGGSRAKLADYVALGACDILDVDENSITANTQQRIYRVTCKGEPEILEGAGQALSGLAYPRYYLDFETIGPGVPFWEGTRPYQPIPVQWSCHIEEEGGDLRHEEFLDLSGQPPMRALADDLIACLGDTGPVLMYTSYERQVIQGLAEMLPDLAGDLEKIVNRLYDLHPVVKQNYYHPDMLGSWSIKAVMPTINAQMDYSKLEGINEGTGASDGFIEAINPDTDMVRKLELEEQLLRYCKFDTEAMVAIVRFFTSSTTAT
jgi:CRISPR/Cas system-associated exonuclease Cas4 (RecB family)